MRDFSIMLYQKQHITHIFRPSHDFLGALTGFKSEIPEISDPISNRSELNVFNGCQLIERHDHILELLEHVLSQVGIARIGMSNNEIQVEHRVASVNKLSLNNEFPMRQCLHETAQ